MSMSFEIFPTEKIIPRCEDIVNISTEMFNRFLKKEGIEKEITINVREESENKVFDKIPEKIITMVKGCQVYNINEEGEIYLLYFRNNELDRSFWAEEVRTNMNAKKLSNAIEANLELGYSWCIKKTMSQPPIVSLYYGYLAIAIAILTKGIIFSGDGAWSYHHLPVEGTIFAKEYLNLAKVSDDRLRENIVKWLKTLKN